MLKISTLRLITTPLLLICCFLLQTFTTVAEEPPSRTLVEGMYGEDVLYIQRFLQQQGYLSIVKPTRYFGPLTKNALIKFQSAHGIEPLGIVGPKTRSLLVPSSSTATAGTSTVPNTSTLLRPGVSGDAVRSLQLFLKDRGYFTYPQVTGYYGSVTEKAVKAFQTAYTITPSGAVDLETQQKIVQVSHATSSSSTSSASSKIKTSSPSLTGVTTQMVQPKSTARSGGGGKHRNTVITTITDTTGPVISLVASSTSSSGATVSWSTDESSDSRLEYGPTTSYGTASTTSDLTTTHSITLSSLLAGALYHFRVKSTDTYGNLTTSGDYTFTTNSELLQVPSGFGWTPSFSMYRTSGGVYTTDFDIESIIPSVTTTYYVDPISGSDSNAGTSRGAPLLNLTTALAKGDVDQVRIINLTDDYVARGSKSWNNTQPTRSISVINETPQHRYISARTSSSVVPTWTVNVTYSNVYQTALSGANSSNVIDVSTATQPTNPATSATISTVPPMYRVYTKLTSVADVAANAGSWYNDGTITYVRPFDDRNIIGDARIIAASTSNNGRFGAGVSGLSLYVQGIDFVGGSTPFLALTGAAGNTGTIAFNDVSFQGSSNSANGLAVQGKLDVYSYRSGAYYNGADGFNYHSYQADGTTAGTSPQWIEIETVAIGNGTTGNAGGSDNNSTSHDYANGIRLNSIYALGDDRVIADTNFAMTWNLGVTAGQAVQQSAAKETYAALTNAKMWLDGCTSYVGSGTNPSYIAAGSASLYYRNMVGVTNAGTGEATGVVTTY
jgi:peptidoglycan hydrolase-like protein with peptidoglycan-binding domain